MAKNNTDTNNFLIEKSMMIITHSGVAKSLIFEAFALAKKPKIELKKISSLLEQAGKELAEASKFHMDVLQLEAEKGNINHNILMIHSEDQMLTTQLLYELSNTIIDLYTKVNKK